MDKRNLRLRETGDPVEKLRMAVPSELIRKPLTKALKRSDRIHGSGPRFDGVMMFKSPVPGASRPLSRTHLRSPASLLGQAKCSVRNDDPLTRTDAGTPLFRSSQSWETADWDFVHWLC